MKVLTPRHLYELDHLDGENKTTFQFVSRGPHPLVEGPINQEVLRMLIDRVKFMEKELPWYGNDAIIHHLRMALTLHEVRALLRHVEFKGLDIENILTGPDGHLELSRQLKLGV